MMNFVTYILGVALLVLMPSQAQGKIWSLNDVLDATCRVNAGSAYGSGTAINEKNGYHYILTNAHVVGSSKTVRVEFFRDGRKTLPIPGRVVFRRLSSGSVLDVAIIAVNSKYFGDQPPRIAVLGKRKEVAIDKYIKSAGCPSARWANSWEGFIVKESESKLIFYPPPIGGQSGSGLYIVANRNGVKQTVLKGIVTWRLGSGGRDRNTGFQKARGGAVLIDKLYDAIEGRSNASFETVPEHWATVNQIRIPVFAHKGAYAYGEDGTYYPLKYNKDGGYIIEGVPNGIKLLAIGVQCPDCGSRGHRRFRSQRPPSLLPIPPRDGLPENPSPNPDNPYDFLPDLDEEEIEPLPPINPPKTDEELNILKKKNAELKENLDNKTSEIASLVEKLSTLEQKYSNIKDCLISEKKILSDEISQLRIDIVNQQSRVQNLVLTLHATEKALTKVKDESNQSVSGLQDSIVALKEKNQTLQNQVEDIVDAHNEEKSIINKDFEEVKQEKVDITEQRNWLGWLSGGLGVGILGWLAKLYMSTNPLRRIENKLDPLQDKVQQAIEPIIGADIAATLRQKIENLEEKVISAVDKLAQQKAEKEIKVQEKESNVVEQKIKDLEEKIVSVVDKLVQQKTEPPTVIVQQVPQLHGTQPPFFDVEEYEIDSGQELEVGVLSDRDKEADVVEELKRINTNMQNVVENLSKTRRQQRPKKKNY